MDMAGAVLPGKHPPFLLGALKAGISLMEMAGILSHLDTTSGCRFQWHSQIIISGGVTSPWALCFYSDLGPGTDSCYYPGVRECLKVRCVVRLQVWGELVRTAQEPGAAFTALQGDKQSCSSPQAQRRCLNLLRGVEEAIAL